MLLLALAPASVLAIHVAYEDWSGRHCTLDGDVRLLAWVLLLLQLRLALDFGLLGLFVQSFRGERVDRTWFYWLVAPIRRDVLAIGP
ncbi:MAG: hypothetical protein QM784_13995, partial [Polyangiaceae bacterium]